MSEVKFTNADYDVNITRVTLQFSMKNERGIPSVKVSPPAVSQGFTEKMTSIIFTTNIAFEYDTEYQIFIAASDFTGTARLFKIDFFISKGAVNCMSNNIKVYSRNFVPIKI